MLSFWARYVVLKEQQGQDRAVTLAAIEAKLGTEVRQQVETELNGILQE